MPERSQPLVSVIMNCLNGEKYLREALDSVYAQTYPRWEIIFWDNASTDSSGEIARSYDERLRYFRGAETIPLGAARNRALEQARGEFIAFLDSDDIWLPDKLEKQIPLFHDPEVGLVFSNAILFNDKGKSTIQYGNSRYSTGKCFAELLANYFLNLQTVMIRSCVLSEGTIWFNPRFNMIEEADLFLRITYKWRIAMLNIPLAKSRVHESSLSVTKAHIVAQEYLEMLDNYNKIFPNFENRYAKEIFQLKTKISIIQARYLIKCGCSIDARKCLAPYLFSSWKVIVFYILTLFPDQFVRLLFKYYTGRQTGIYQF